jgi:Fur family transcriptional regulator, ferric uptake regulator
MKTAPSVAPFIRLFGRYLRDQGLPVTSQREVVAEVVFTTEGHLSVDDLEHELRRRGERIGKATIYRTLDLLVRSKLVEEHDFEEGFKRYEHRLSREPVHAHLVCTETGNILEFRSPEVQQIIDEVAREHGFLPTHHKLVIFGLSREAREEGATVRNEGLTCPIETV